MNLGRTLYNYDLIPKIVVDPYWLLGFIVAEGTFGFKNLSPYFFLFSSFLPHLYIYKDEVKIRRTCSPGTKVIL